MDSAVRIYVQPSKVASEVNNQFRKFLTAKDIQNRRQKIEGISLRYIFNDLRSEPGNIVHVTTDADNEVNMIYIQLREQRELFKCYPEAAQLDGTHRTNQLGIPLYTILVKDKFGLGQPACYFFFREESKERILSGLRLFAQVRSLSLIILLKRLARTGLCEV